MCGGPEDRVQQNVHVNKYRAAAAAEDEE